MRKLVVPLASAFRDLEPSCREIFGLLQQGDGVASGLLVHKYTTCLSLIAEHTRAIGRVLEATVCLVPICPFPEMSEPTASIATYLRFSAYLETTSVRSWSLLRPYPPSSSVSWGLCTHTARIW